MTYAELLEKEKDFVQFKKTFILQYDPNGITHTFNKDDEQDKMLLAAIEKQIPKKPFIFNTFQRHCECGNIVKTYQNYCCECGQALDWSDIE